MPKEGIAIIVGVLGFVLGSLMMGVSDANHEEKACKKLEKRVGVNLVYTWNDGCQLADDV